MYISTFFVVYGGKEQSCARLIPQHRGWVRSRGIYVFIAVVTRALKKERLQCFLQNVELRCYFAESIFSTDVVSEK